MSSVRPKLKLETPKFVTAWDVRTGRPVYRALDGTWVLDTEDAAVFIGEAGEAALAAAKAEEGLILDAYVMEATADGEVGGRETLRETIRASGPTVRLDLGPQAEPRQLEAAQ